MALPSWIDSHCHLHDPRLPDGIDGAVDAARAAGVSHIITVGTDRDTSLAAIAAAGAHDHVAATVGLHPHDAVNGIETISDLLEPSAIARHGIVAVGEAGLDYYYDHSPRDVQQQVFAAQIRLANERSLPLVIHTRDAWEDTFDILDREGVPERTVFHCFTGGVEEARACLDRGGFISFSGIVTFVSALDVQAAARACPLDRLLVETDSPYLAPVPHRGARNRPAWVVAVGEFIADLRGLPVEAVATSTSATARAVFGLAD